METCRSKLNLPELLKIPESQISTFISNRDLSFRLEDNRTFNGKTNFGESGNFTIEGESEEFKLSAVRHLWDSSEDDPLILSAQSKAAALLLKWQHILGFDLSGSSGNSENLGLGIRLDSSLANELRGYDLYFSYNKADKASTPIVDETKFGIEYDSKFFDSLAWYAKSDFENDRIEEIDLRATSALGLKYAWIDEKEYQVSFRSGMAFRYEKSGVSSSQDQSDPAIDLGFEYAHEIKDYLSLESDFSYVPSLDEFQDFLITQDTALIFPLSKEINWNIRSGISGTYNSTPAALKEELDLKYYLRLVFLFK